MRHSRPKHQQRQMDISMERIYSNCIIFLFRLFLLHCQTSSSYIPFSSLALVNWACYRSILESSFCAISVQKAAVDLWHSSRHNLQLQHERNPRMVEFQNRRRNLFRNTLLGRGRFAVFFPSESSYSFFLGTTTVKREPFTPKKRLASFPNLSHDNLSFHVRVL